MSRPMAWYESLYGYHNRWLLGWANSKKAAEFSFLLGLITLSAASAYKVLTDGAMLTQTLDIQPMLIGILVAFISAIYAIRFLVNCLTRYGLAPFAWYRIALSFAIILIFLPKI